MLTTLPEPAPWGVESTPRRAFGGRRRRPLALTPMGRPPQTRASLYEDVRRLRGDLDDARQALRNAESTIANLELERQKAIRLTRELQDRVDQETRARARVMLAGTSWGAR